MYCYRRLLQINWTLKVTNGEIRKRLHQKRFNASSDEKEVGIIRTLCRMKNNRKIKDVMTGMMEGTGRRGRPCREWMDDITDWYQTDVHRLSLLAQDRDTCKMIIKNALDTYGSVPMDHDDDDDKEIKPSESS